MSDHSIAPHTRDNMMRDFAAGVSKLRYELAKNLADIDVLKSDKLENVTSVFNQRLIVFQHDFLQLIAQTRGTAPNQTNDVNLKASGRSHIPTVLGGVAGAFGGSAAAGMVVATATTGMWWWTQTHALTLATVLATGIGASADVVSGGLTLGGGVVGAIAVNKAIGGTVRKRIRKRIIADFDTQIVPQLTSWAEGLLNE